MHTGSTTFSLGGSAAGSPLPLVDLDCSSNPNYPAAAKGYRIRVTIAGKIGGASGKVVEAGDVVEAVADNAGGTEASVGTSWIVIQANIAGMTAAGLSMITAADAAAQAALLTTLMPKAGGSFTGLTGAGFRDTSAAFDVTMTFASSTVLDGARSITWDVKNASHQLKFTAASIVTFPAGTNTLLGSAVANTITTNGAASTPAMLYTGTWFTGGTATTTKPQLLIEPAGTATTGWSTSGTGLGVNAASGFVGNLIDLQLVGVSKFKVASTGAITATGATIDTSGNITMNGSNAYIRAGGRGPMLGVSAIPTSMSDAGPVLASTASILFTDGSSYGGTIDAGVSRISSALLKITDGTSGYGTLDAAGFKVSGVAGVSFSGTATNFTFVNGILTAAS